MAKGKKRSKRSEQSREPSDSLAPLRTVRLAAPLVEDRRRFDFEPATSPARLFSGLVAGITAVPRTTKKMARASRVPYQIAFSAPRETLVCVRRKIRREVLHALGRKGKGGRGRRNKWSDVKC